MNRRTDLLTGLAAAIAIIGVVAGIPALLVTQVGWPLPTTVPNLAEVTAAARLGAIPAATIVKAAAVVAWAAWAWLATALMLEGAALARGVLTAPVKTVGARWVAARLLPAVLLLAPARPALATATPLAAAVTIDTISTHPEHILREGLPTAPRSPSTLEKARALSAADEPSEAQRVHVVKPRETLWSIADDRLGDGHRWREIHARNVDRVQPDGGRLSPGDDLIRPGWQLVLPPPTGDDTAATPVETARAPDRVVVERGDSLWDLAEDHLDDGHRWAELYELNDDRPQPDGDTLDHPDLIRPGWTLQLPPTATQSSDRTTTDRPPPPPPDDNSETADAGGQAADLVGVEVPQPGTVTDTPSAATAANGSDSGSVWSPALERPTIASSANGDAGTAAGQASAAADGEDAGLEGWRLPLAGLLAAGVIVLLRRLRRTQLRRRPAHADSPSDPDPVEQQLAAEADHHAAVLIPTALRSLAARLRARGQVHPPVAGVLIGDTVQLLLAASDPDPPDGWETDDDARVWRLVADPADLVDEAATASTPVATLATLGWLTAGQVLLHLEHAGVVTVTGPDDDVDALLATWAVELATSPTPDALEILLVGTRLQLPTTERIRQATDLTEVIDELRDVADRAGAELDRLHTDTAAAARHFTADADTWTPRVVLCDPSVDPLQLEELVALVDRTPAVGVVAVVAGGDEHTQPASTTVRLDGDEVSWTSPGGMVTLRPTRRLTHDELAKLTGVIDAARTMTEVTSPEPDTPSTPGRVRIAAADCLPDGVTTAPVLLRVFGVPRTDGLDLAGGRALELLAYLATHPDGVTRDVLGEALWPGRPPNPALRR